MGDSVVNESDEQKSCQFLRRTDTWHMDSDDYKVTSFFFQEK